MKTIGFIGLGLIGGSIAKAIRKYHEDYRLLAYDQDRETLAAAVSSNMIDAVCEEHDERFRSCDYIFLCAPVEFNVKYLEYFKDNIGPDTILTDVGSVKGIIHKEVERLGMESRFIGGHPMAGSEKTGFEASSDRLIENAYYIITPGGEVALERLTDFTEMISSLGAIPMVLTSEEHDFITAGVSHLPHIIASALVNLVNMLDSDQEYMKTIAAGGFRDITRIASSSPIMWEQICVENNQNISNVLDDYIRLLVQIKCFVDNKDSRSLYQMFASSRDYRDSIDVVDNGLLKKAYVLYLDIADEPAVLLRLPLSLQWRRSALKISVSFTTVNLRKVSSKLNSTTESLWKRVPHSLKKEIILSTSARAYLKNHSRNLHAPLCGIFHPNSVAVARYAPSSGQNIPQIVTHILQKAFFRHVLAGNDPAGILQ